MLTPLSVVQERVRESSVSASENSETSDIEAAKPAVDGYVSREILIFFKREANDAMAEG